MAVTTTQTNKPLNPRGNDQSPKGYNRAELYSGKALDFDGVNDYVDLDGFTMAGNVATIVFQAKFENNNYFFDINTQRFVITNTANDGFRVYNSNAWASYGDTLRDEIGFYAVVSDGTTQRAYYNGHQLGSDQTITALNWSSATQVKIGSHNGGGTNYFHGQIAGFKIFNTALTAAQVVDLYNNPEKVVPTGVADSALKLWLPMQEGAGTTAYDGSGNGNHGAVSGASWLHGIGAPVSQTAVIDWNKGSNTLTHSEDFTNAIYLRASVGTTAPVITANQATAPDGQLTADKIVFPAVSGVNNLSVVYRNSVSLSGAHNSAIYLKGENGGEVVYFYYLIGGPTTYYTKECVLTTEWQRFDIDFTGGSTSYWHLGVDLRTGSGQVAQSASTIYAWGTNTNAGSLGPYIPTLSTAQTSDVLLPQGLTSGRDITGVNLFENVRKQGALNLDGNSWVEVHDNASVDLTTNLSIEAWCYPTLIGDNGGREILGKFISASVPYQCYAIEYKAEQFNFGIGATDNTWSGVASLFGKSIENWYHVVATYDGATRKIYVNGIEEGSAAFTKTPQTTDKNIAIGRWLGQAVGNNNTFFGPIAQPRIYNRALTAEEVQRNYNAGKNIYTND